MLQRLLRVIGWTAAVLFWVTFIGGIVFLLTASNMPGLTYVLIGAFVILATSFPVLILPVGIIAYGMDKERGQHPCKAFFKWATIAAAAHLSFLLLVATITCLVCLH